MERRQVEDKSQFRAEVSPVLYLALIFLFNFIGRIAPAPLMPAIEADLGLTHGQAGSFFLLMTAGYFVTVMASGFLSSRINHRNTIIFSAAAVGLELLFVSMCQGLWGIRFGLFGLGLAAGFYLPSGIAVLTSLVSSKNWGKALAIHELAPNLGFVLAPLLAEAFLGFMTWRGVLDVLGLLSILLAFVFFRFGRGGRFKGEPPNLKAFKVFLDRPSFWIMIALFSAGVAGSLGIYSMLPLYLTAERGMDRGFANTIVGLSRVAGVFTSLIAGWATDRIGAQRTLVYVLFVTGFLTLLLAGLPGWWVILPVFLQPMVAVCFFPAGFAAISYIGPPEIRSIAVSLTVPTGFLLGGGIVPIGIGMMGDAGVFDFGIAAVGLCILLGSLLSRSLRFYSDSPQ
ncbi:MAG: MFS transporter [Deltaproteobacteria bacterium]|nr:MFS transporter [Deltaproteobacteria bacterium]